VLTGGRRSFVLFVGIDWSDRSLEYHLRSADGRVLAEGSVRPDVAGLGELYLALEVHGPPAEIGIAIETTHGPWVQALLDRGYRVYPVNPKSAERFRQALSAAGNKSDRIDCTVLGLMLATLHQQLRPLHADDPEIVALRIACQDRVRLVEERTAKLNELRAILKVYYPASAGLFPDLDSQTALQFLQQFPTQQQMRRLTPRRLRTWLGRHNYTRMERLESMQAALIEPVLPVAEHLQAAKAGLIQYLATALLMLKAEIAERERQITDRFERLPEANWIGSLPGIGPNLGPALLACLGRDPERFASLTEARALMGTAPVTKASGRSHVVVFRRGCWKFARRTLQLFADQSRHLCTWAQKFYEQQRASGHGHHAALRALAHKWLKIILAMRRTAAPYDANIFANSRRRQLSAAPAPRFVNSVFSNKDLT
jgi:transposase